MPAAPVPFEYQGREAPALLEVCRRCVASPLHRLTGAVRYCPKCGATGPTPGHVYQLVREATA